jgi:hypothetical protein
MRTLVFDMDGTIANFYGVDGWLADLRNENTRPYEVASPLYDMDILNSILNAFKNKGWNIVVTTWLAKDGSQEFNNRTRVAKKEWLDRYNFPYDDVHMVKYGTTKANCTRKLGGFQILVDDNANVRKGWTLGATIDANENIIETLLKILMSA